MAKAQPDGAFFSDLKVACLSIVELVDSLVEAGLKRNEALYFVAVYTAATNNPHDPGEQ